MSEQTHWTEQKEVIKTNKPLKLLLVLFKYTPGFMVRALIYPVAFFYWIFAPQARKVSVQYQKRLREFTGRNIPKHISSYRQFLSFSLCVLEKMEGWLGKIKFNKIQYQNDDITSILDLLRQGKGAMLITSHLGNMELLRSLSDYNEQLVGREVPVYVVMDMKVNSNFSDTHKSVNPKVSFNVISSNEIGPDSIVTLMEAVEKGSLVVIAGDRTSVNAPERNIKQTFLNERAEFPYGAFFLASLLKAPVYFVFPERSKDITFKNSYDMHVYKPSVDFNCPRGERSRRIEVLCSEFVKKLEYWCEKYPYQWYNFFDFWSVEKNERK